MYYEDENSLYHYSYRKNDSQHAKPVIEASFREAPPIQEEATVETPKKKRHAGRLLALALSCALVGGVVGAGATVAISRLGRQEASIGISQRQVAEVTRVAVDGTRQMNMPQVYQANVNSVVSINVSTTSTNAFGQRVENAASGSGFIISQNGYIVTNYHVVKGASKVEVTLYNGDTYDAEIIGGDADYDIAVVKVEAENLPPVTLGDSSKISIGETVAAIGNPLGELTFSMTQGIISCADRAINVDGTPFNMIQVDCSINPGNSGGPLFNSYGEVIGIVSAKYASYANTTVEGLGFAIPMNDVYAMIEDIMTNGYVTDKPYLGISAGTLTKTMEQQFRLSVSSGVFVYSVEENSAAERAGLKMGDVIVKLADKKITSMSDLTAAKKSYKAGNTVDLTISREGKEQVVSLTFDVTPAVTETEEEEQKNTNNNGYYSDDYYSDNRRGGNYYSPWDYFNYFFGG